MGTSESKSKSKEALVWVHIENQSHAFNADNPITGEVIISSTATIPAYGVTVSLE